MKKVLIITYHWPPSGNAGVYRWLKFVKYLREFGWEPIVYTSKINQSGENDLSLLKDIPENLVVIRRSAWEPYKLYKLFIGKKKNEKINVGFLEENSKFSILNSKLNLKFKIQNLKFKISVWIRGNFFIPDARCFWVKPSVKFLVKYISENPVDAIVSTGPPHSMHLIAMNLINKLKLEARSSKLETGNSSLQPLTSNFQFPTSKFQIPKWLADFRDPWTFIDFYDDLKLTKWADKKHHNLERKVLQNADKVVTVSLDWAKNLEQIMLNGEGLMLNKKNQIQHSTFNIQHTVKVITNGFDSSDLYSGKISLDEKFTIVHIGSLTKSRNPITLWKALASLEARSSKLETGNSSLQPPTSNFQLPTSSFSDDLQIKLVGKTDYSVISSIEEAGLKNNLLKLDYLPHTEVIKIIQQSQLLLLLVNNTNNAKGIIPGKFFEYLSAKRPILVIGRKDGDIAGILKETRSGKIVDFNDYDEMLKIISEYYNLFKKGKLSCESGEINKYSRRELTSDLANTLNQILNSKF